MKIDPIIPALCAALSLAPGPAAAETLTEHVFHYHGGPISHMRAGMDASTRGGPYWTAYWNPDHRISRPGFHVSFWGSGTGCSRVANGPVTSQGDHVFRREKARKGETREGYGVMDGLYRSTYLPESPGNRELKFTPTSRGVKACKDGRGDSGLAHIHVNEDPKLGGIGLYTHAGPRPDSNAPAFFQPFPAAGQNGQGGNKHIQGSFVTFRFARSGQDTMKPWSGKANSKDGKLRVAIRTQQRVAKLPESLSEDREITQVKQQVAVIFANRECLANRRRGEICQMNFLIHTALWQDIRRPRLERATLMFDPVQGGLPVVYGPLRQASNATMLNGHDNVEAWTSWGEATKSAPFGTTRFQAEISFDKFLEILRVVAFQKRLADAKRDLPGTARSVTLESTTDEHIARVFGSGFRSPREWFLLDAHFAQEVHSPNPQDRAYIGGSMTELYIAALPR